jgi:nucleoside phosphorylase
MKDKKILLTIAHRGEAQEFLRKGRFNPRPFYFDGVYASDREILLLTGEGLQTSTEKTAAVCAAFRDEIFMVINIGIAASLDAQIQPGNIYSIRTAYAETNQHIVFKTFTSEDQTAVADCISAHHRVLEAGDARRLAAFAPIVDRELWGCASVCALFNLPFRSYKLISDVAGDNSRCPDIQERAAEFSERLYQFYCELSLHETPTAKRPAEEFLLPEGFYATTFQKKQLKALLRNLQIKYQLSEREIFEKIQPGEIIQKEANPKRRTALAIAALGNLLNPFNSRLKAQLEALCQPLTEANCQVQFTRDYEDDKIELSVKIENSRHLEKLKAALEKFNYAEVIKILNGEVNL